MAETVQITSRGNEAKIRNPVLVVVFSIITFGIYHLFWYYFVNREMADWGHEHKTDIGDSPGMSVLAITLGAIIIVPPFVSIFHTGKRMELSQQVADIERGSGLLYFILTIIPIAAWIAPAYLQVELNKVWRTQQQAPASAGTTEPPATPQTPV